MFRYDCEKRILVTLKQYIGRTQRCIFIGFLLVEIYLDTSFYTGQVLDVVIEIPLYPPMVGNMERVNDKFLMVSEPVSVYKVKENEYMPHSKAKKQASNTYI